VNLDPADAAELADLLQFIAGWTASDREHMSASLLRYIGDTPYSPGHLRLDLDRFTSLLREDNGESLTRSTGNDEF
jgi:hypothetical protein